MNLLSMIHTLQRCDVFTPGLVSSKSSCHVMLMCWMQVGSQGETTGCAPISMNMYTETHHAGRHSRLDLRQRCQKWSATATGTVCFSYTARREMCTNKGRQALRRRCQERSATTTGTGMLTHRETGKNTGMLTGRQGHTQWER